MYGMSAKDRLAMFETKAGGDTTKKSGAPAKKKIGKLNVPGPKDPKASGVAKKASDLKKVSKKVKPKEEKPEQEKKVVEEVKKVEEMKEEELCVNDVEVVVKLPQQKEDAIEEAKVDAEVLKQAEKKKADAIIEQPKTTNEKVDAVVVEKVKEEKVQEEECIVSAEAAAIKEEEVQEKNAEETPKTDVKEKPKVDDIEQKTKDQPMQKEQPKLKDNLKPKLKEQPKPKDALNPKPKEQLKPKDAQKAEPKIKGELAGTEEKRKPAENVPEKAEAKPEEQQPAAVEVKDILDGPQKPKIRPLEARMPLYKSVPEEFYDTLFYFSGMGTVVGSALNEGVFVPQRATRTALETKVIEDIEAERDKDRQHETYLIRTARKQAFNIAEELRKLQGLLSGLPSFGKDNTGGGELHRIERKPVDSIMHAKYHTYQIPHQPKKPRTPPPPPPAPTKAEKPWPPPMVAPAAPPVQPAAEVPWPPPSMVQQESKMGLKVMGKANVGVFKGTASSSDRQEEKKRIFPVQNPGFFANATTQGSSSQKPWQEKYGTHGVAKVKAPEPFHPATNAKGLKPWQLSRVTKGSEVKGYHHFTSHDQPDYRASVEVAGAEEDMSEDISSLAPFLVSNKSQRMDRQHVLETARDATMEHHHLTMKEYYGSLESSVPYHDF